MFRIQVLQRLAPSSSRAVSAVAAPSAHQVQSSPRERSLRETATGSSSDAVIDKALKNAESRKPFTMRNSEEMNLEGMSPMAKRMLLRRQQAGKMVIDADASEIISMETSSIDSLRPKKAFNAKSERAAINTGTSYYPKGATMRTSGPRITTPRPGPRPDVVVDTSSAFPTSSARKTGPNPSPRTLSPRKKSPKSAQAAASKEATLVNPAKFTPFVPLNLSTLIKKEELIVMKNLRKQLQLRTEAQGDYSRFILPTPNPSKVDVIGRLRHGLANSGVELKDREFIVGKVQALMTSSLR